MFANDQLRILFVMNGFDIGGAELDVLKLAKGFIDKGHYAGVASKRGELVPELISYQIPHFDLVINTYSPKRLLNTCYRLSKIIRHSNFNVINPQSIKSTVEAFLASFYLKCLYPNKKYRIPIITTIHNIHDTKNDLLSIKILNSLSDKIVFVSEFERNRLIEKGLKSEKTCCIYSGLFSSEDHFKQQNNLSKDVFGIPATAPVICTVARLSPEKGHFYLLKAASYVIKHCPKAFFLIVGDGPLRNELIQQSKEMGISSNIIFAGQRNDIYQILSICDIFVLSSIKESLPRSIREAMYFNLPVVATNVGGIPEVVKHGKTGLLVPPENSQSLARAIITLLDDPNIRIKMGHAGRKLIEEFFKMKDWIAKTEDLFYKLIYYR